MPPYERKDLVLFAFVLLPRSPSAFHLFRHGFAVPPSPPGEGFLALCVLTDVIK